MRHHRRMREALQSLLDGELSAARRVELERHLDGCPECAAALGRLAESDRWFCAARPDPAALSPEASQALFERALAQAARRSLLGLGAGLSWRLAIATVLAVAALGTWGTRASWLQGRRGSDQATIAQIGDPPLPWATPGPRDPVSVFQGDSNRRLTFGPAIELTTMGPARLTSPSANASEGAGNTLRKDPTVHSVSPVHPVPSPKNRNAKSTPPGKRKATPTTAPPSPADTHALPRIPRLRAPRPRFAARPPADTARLVAASPEDETPATFAWACLSRPEAPAATESANTPSTEAGGEEGGEEPAGSAAVGRDPTEAVVASEPASSEPLLVVVTNEMAPAPITVTEASFETPGYARATAVRPTADGVWTLAQATVTTGCGGAERSLVTLDSRDWLSEQANETGVKGTERDDHGNPENRSADSAP